MKNLVFTSVVALVLVFGTAVSASAGNGNDNDGAHHDVKVGISDHALVGISSDATIELQPAAPEVAGDGLNFDVEDATDNSVWLNYSSILKNKNSSNTISVSIDGDDLPGGVYIELVAAEDAGNGKGVVGETHDKKIALSGSSQEVVTGIKNCYTGSGSGSGHQLTYSLKLDNEVSYGELASGSFTTTVTYTITDN